MDQQEALNITLTINMPDCTEEELDAATRRLLRELREMDVESAALTSTGSNPPGAKGVDPITVGAIALAVLPTTLPKILEFLQAWSLQGRGRTIKFKGTIADQQVDFEGSFSDMEKVVKMLEKKNKRAKK